jgi:uncharacterized membrane protein
MTVESSATFGEIGAILMFIGPLSPVISVVGLILLLVAFHGLAGDYKDSHIFSNVIFGVFAVIIGAVIAVVIIVIAAFGLLSVLGINISNWTNWTALQNFNWQSFTNWSALVPYAVAIIGALFVLFVFIVVAAIFLRRSINTLYDKSGVHMFATTGLVLLIGACLTVVIIGFVLLWVSLILLAVAFSRMRHSG